MRPTALWPALLAGLHVLALSPSTPAQYSNESLTLPGKRIHFVVPDKLGATPLQLGTEGPHLVARFEPTDDGDYIWGKYGKYPWGLYVYAFETHTAKDPEPTTGDEGKPRTREEAEQAAREEAMNRSRAANFLQWVREKDPNRTGSRRFVVEGKEKKGTSKRPGFSWWEYFDVKKFTYGGREDEIVIYKTACVYDLDGTEVALLFYLPLKSGDKPDSKYALIARRVLTSLQVEEVDSTDEAVDEDRDQFADTPERKAALKKLKDNIADLNNWDYFTSPNYVFTFSWEADKPATKREIYEFARSMEGSLENIREKFEEHYPPHEEVQEAYSVIRICHDLEEFEKYGNTRGGVVGWFSPMSKELVIYFDKRRVMLQDEDEMLSVCYHEAWHQYSDQYFPGVTLHRWFDEGLAEYFGSLRKKGRRWVHQYHRGRLQALNRQENEDSLIASAEIVTWHTDKFYGPRAPDHYAQAWAMVDFLVRGQDMLGRRWNDRWSEILPIYSQVCLEKKSEKKAVEEAFAGVDWDEFEKAWRDWFDKGMIKRN